MYLKDMISDTGSYQPPRQLRRRDRESLSKHREALTRSIALTDGFDAPTTEAPTVWNATGIEGVEGRDYDVSISGYQNYVNEMEMMLSGQDDASVAPPQPYYPEREDGVALSVRGSEMGGHVRGRNASMLGGVDNSREVSSRRTRVELVEHRVVEDGPERTISLWREQVAESTSMEDLRKSSQEAAPRRICSNDSHTGRHVSNRSGGRSSGSGSAGHGKNTSKDSGADGYERTEYMISYQRPSRQSDASRRLYAPSLQHSGSPSGRRRSNTSLKPSVQRSGSTDPMSPMAKNMPGQPFEQRTEYMVSYLHTPPHSQGSESRSSSKRNAYPLPHSPVHTRAYVPMDAIPTGSAVKSTTTSPVELILSSCEPSLLHIAPVVSELGILKVEHLRAMARMNEETRDRELKCHALMRGVTVMEWAILIDKLQSL
ncbi:hypothetical protein BC835DRAFT_290242 [Cytidiella melzeri]|nr:hypothetical protein BC835DRAFT_290242 [Cytidiella melzeri]